MNRASGLCALTRERAQEPAPVARDLAVEGGMAVEELAHLASYGAGESRADDGCRAARVSSSGSPTTFVYEPRISAPAHRRDPDRIGARLSSASFPKRPYAAISAWDSVRNRIAVGQ